MEELTEPPAAERPKGRPRLVTLCRRSAGRVDGIRDYTVCLVAALNATGQIRADLLWREDDGTWSTACEKREIDPSYAGKHSLQAAVADCDVLVVQYNPFLYGRWGFAPWLPLTLLRLRFSRRRPRIALMVHEPFVPMINWRWKLMGAWQRLQLMILRLGADVVFASIEIWAERLAGAKPRRPTYHLPVGSNVPDGRRFRNQQRRQIGADQGAIVLATFGESHPARLAGSIVEASNLLAQDGRQVVLLNLGANAPPLPQLDRRVLVHTPGYLSASEIARWLSAADIYLAPFTDGASTRRATVMAAMQQGLPIVATDGALTDTIFRSSDVLQLVPVHRPEQFCEKTRKLVESPDERRVLGRRGRDLYATYFDWPNTARRLLDCLGVGSWGVATS